jgi:4-hydroxybenzoyl-CoA thioesterase
MFSGTTSFEIQFGDCDPAGIVYYPNYFRYFDNATAGLISAALGMNKPAWLAEHAIAGIPMVDTGAKFLRPSRFGDRVRIESRFGDLGRSSFVVQHVLLNGEERAVEAHEKRVWAVRDEAGGIRGASLPDAVRRAFEAP